MDTAGIRSDWVGRVIDGRFALVEWLGGSASAGVFLTELPVEPSQKAVIKLVAADSAGAEAQIANWARAAALSHPHLMRLFHSGHCEIDDVALLFVVTEYADEVLSQILLERPLTPTEAREMLDPVLDTLAYLHDRGFVHGCVKPSNILVVGDQLKLSGDCIQVAGEGRIQSSEPGVYDAPELSTGTISEAADIWSLGMTLVEVLTQDPAVWDRSKRAGPILPETLAEPFAAIARESLMLDPARRCSIGEIRALLDPEKAIPDLSAESRRAETREPGRGGRGFGWAIGAAAVVIVAVIAILAWRAQHVVPSLSNAKEPPAMQAPPAKTESYPSTKQSPKRMVVKGEVAERIMPEVAPNASASITGRFSVRVRVIVDASGAVSNASLDRPGPSEYFAKVALEAAQRWRFKPAQVKGHASASVWFLQFQFNRGGTEVTPVEVSP